MEDKTLRVQMFGTFTLQIEDRVLDDNRNRSKKLWLLLAYMIYCRAHTVTQEDLFHLLWGEKERSSNPVNALKTMFHRLRAMLSQLYDEGEGLIIRKEGSYAWNNNIPISLDIDEFDSLCGAAAMETVESVRQDKQIRALRLYQDDFLPKLSSEPWVVPISVNFHSQYISLLLNTLPYLEINNRMDEVAEICQKGLQLEPHNEEICQHFMRALLALDRQSEAAAAYEALRQLLADDFGVTPSDETHALYREAVRTVNGHPLSIAAVQEQLRETEDAAGAMLCDYDFFRVIYHAIARAIQRNGSAVHIGLLTVNGKKGLDISKRSLNCCMENLRTLVQNNLRKGDIAARCSISQYILMLPQANYENSCMICERIIHAFTRQYPHSPAELHYSVHGIIPNI